MFKIVDIDVFSPIFLMPMYMFLAAQGWMWLIFSFTSILLAFMFIYVRTSKAKVRTRFFLAWSVVSFFFLLGVFELEVVPYLEILFIENFVLMCFVSTMCVCAYLAKSNSSTLSASTQLNGTAKTDQVKKTSCEVCCVMKPLKADRCNLCGYCIPKRDQYSVWLDIYIGPKNNKYFLAGVVAFLLSCLYSSNLTLTTICHPTLIGGILLMPDDCSDVYEDIHIAICFVSAVYTVIVTMFGTFLLLQQTCFICRNSVQEWKQGQKAERTSIGQSKDDILSKSTLP